MLLSVERPFVGAFAFHIAVAKLPAPLAKPTSLRWQRMPKKVPFPVSLYLQTKCGFLERFPFPNTHQRNQIPGISSCRGFSGFSSHQHFEQSSTFPIL
jgi:hypothetical protein